MNFNDESKHFPGKKEFIKKILDIENKENFGIIEDLEVKYEIESDKKSNPEGNRKKIYFCGICNKDLPTELKLKQHKNKVHEKKKSLFNCEICSEKFYLESKFIRHAKTVHDEKKPFRNDSYITKAYFGLFLTHLPTLQANIRFLFNLLNLSNLSKEV